MMRKVLVTAPYMQPVIERFRPLFQKNGIEVALPPVHERLSEEELLRWIPGVHGVICGDDQFTARVLESADRLRVISKWGTGIDSIDQEACRRIGIAVRNTPNAFSEPVADTVLGYMLMFARRLHEMNDHMKTGSWEKIPGVCLRECTLGVIGVGNCGKAVVRRAVSFGMQILGNDIIKTPEGFVEQTGIRMTSKEDLLQQADFVSLNADLNPTSFHIIGADELSRMKPTAVLINAARGPLVDETALIAALQQKMIAGAALDVFEVEPLPTESPLRQMPNVLMAPHNANSSPAAWERIHQSTIDNLLAVLNDGS
jgi:D-3-phosphoglycerate dehydrogenase / 2-oxoglutarate reductase